MADITDPAVIIVNDKYAKSVALANDAAARAASATQAFNASIYQPAQFDVKWQTLAAPSLPEVPSLPALPEIAFIEPDGQPGALSASIPDIVIDEINLPIPALNFGQAPKLTIGQAPALPQVREVVIPDAPQIQLPDAPQLMALQTHTFGGVNLHEEWLEKLDNIPELSLLQPAPFDYRPGARYASQLLQSLKATLNARIQGGSGIAPAVEQQIWDRSRDRETQIALAREQEVLRSAESLGFPLPSGVLAGQLADARREYHDKLSGLSRDVAIKQAELEQSNLQNSIQSAMQLENNLMEDAYRLEMLGFEASKAAADNAIAAHNAALEHFKALLAGYQAYAAAYETVVKSELSKIEVFKALLSAEEIKATINNSLVQQYKAEIEGSMAAVEIYKARVGAAQTLVQLEGARIQAGAEQVKAFVATVNAETAKADMYKTQVSAEATKVEAAGAVARAYGAKVGAQAEKARAEVARFQALVSAKGMEWDAWKAKLQAATTRMDAAAKTSSVIVDGYRLGASAVEAQAGVYMRRWEADMKQYEAGKELSFRIAKSNADAVAHANDMKMEAAKITLATASQGVASAWSMVSASAGVDSRMSYSYQM